MDEADYLRSRDLGNPSSVLAVDDCRVLFARQRLTEDLWCVARGPRGILGWAVVPGEVLRQVRDGRVVRSTPRIAALGREWQQVALEDVVVGARRRRGDRLELALMFPDGTRFGGAEAGLPTLHLPSLRERIRRWIRGRHGGPPYSATRQRTT